MQFVGADKESEIEGSTIRIGDNLEAPDILGFGAAILAHREEGNPPRP